jgi:hypothetical protein
MASMTKWLARCFGWMAVAGSAIAAGACGGSSSGGSACTDGGSCPTGTSCSSQGVCVPDGTGGSSAAAGAGGGGLGGGGTGGVAGGGAGGAAGSGGMAGTGGGDTATVLAFRKLFLGDTNRQGIPDAQAWTTYGLDIDGLVSTPQAVEHCKPVEGAIKSMIQLDGVDGIDNSFGYNLVPIFGALVSSPSESVTESIVTGEWTMMVRLPGLTSASDQTGIAAGLYSGAPRGAPPQWNGTELWPVSAESVQNGDLGQPKVVFSSFVAGGKWVSGAPKTIAMVLSLSFFELAVTIDHAVVTMDIQGTGSAAHATQGVIAGVIRTEPFIADLKKAVAVLDSSLCDGAAFESIAAQIRQASDIMADGTNGDSIKTCDAISVGLGFDASSVVLGAVASPKPPPIDPCS